MRGFSRVRRTLSDRRYHFFGIPIAAVICAGGVAFLAASGRDADPPAYPQPAASQQPQAAYQRHAAPFYTGAYAILNALSFSQSPASVEALVAQGDLREMPASPGGKGSWSVDAFGAVRFSPAEPALCSALALGKTPDQADLGEGGARCYTLLNGQRVGVYRERPRPASERGFQLLRATYEQSDVSARIHVILEDAFLPSCPSDAIAFSGGAVVIRELADQLYCVPAFVDEVVTEDYGVFYAGHRWGLERQTGGHRYKLVVNL
jgi:hypothetical protein